MSDLQNLTPANTYKGLLQVGDYTNGVDSTVKAVLDGEGTASALAIGTTKVGIGTTSPTQELDVNGDIVSTTLTTSGAVTAGSLDVSGNVVADEYALDQTGTSSSAVAIHAPATNELAIRTNSTEAMRIDSNGNVGIGTTNADVKLQVEDSAVGTNIDVLQLTNTDDSTGAGAGIEFFSANAEFAYIRGSRPTDTTYGHLTLGIRGAGDVINIRDEGNVGIGTTNPNRKLDVQGVQGWQDSNGAERAGLNPAIDGSDLQLFDSNGDSCIRFDSRSGGNNYICSGNVGIGTVSPSAPLEVSSTTGGVIMPRMTTTQMNAISSPTDGEMIYNTTANKFYGRANGAWVALH
jgi:hypothetical protein